MLRLRLRYFRYKREHHRKPVYYDRSAWTPIPAEFEP